MNHYELVARIDDALDRPRSYIDFLRSKPPVTFENPGEVFEHYADREPSPIAQVGQKIGAVVLRPNIVFMPGAEQEINENFGENLAPAYVSSHVSNTDPFLVASVIGMTDALTEMREGTIIPSKIGLFQASANIAKIGNKILKKITPDGYRFPEKITAVDRVIGAIQRHLLEGMGARPIYREQDIAGYDTGVLDKEEEKLFPVAERKGGRFYLSQTKKRVKLAIFPEGERNQIDPDTVQEFKAGIGAMATKDYFVIPSAIRYREGSITRATVVIGNPIKRKEHGKNREGFVHNLQTATQDCLDHAIEISQ